MSKTMYMNTAGCVFLAFLVLFPVAVHSSPRRCVTYKHRQTCGVKDHSVDFPCSYPKDVQGIKVTGWSRGTDKNQKPKLLKQIPALSSRLHYVEHRNGDCTLKLTDLKMSDKSTYYFIYSIRNGTGHGFMCGGDPGVSLNVFFFAVKILVETHVRGQNLSAVTVGQRITLTCVPTCPSSLNSTLSYIWYKNRQQLNAQKANSYLLSLDPVSNEDTGSYICAIMGHEDLHSSAINIRVQEKPSNTESEFESEPDTTPAQESAPTLGFDSQNSTDQRFNNYETPSNKGLLKVSVTLVTSVCVGFAIGMSLTVLVFKLKCKDQKKRREYVRSVCERPDPNSDSYNTLGVSTMFGEYETLDAVRCSSAAEADYENLQLRNLSE